MKLETLKNQLTQIDQLSFKLQDGSIIPSHFHITEIGINNKIFIDCGGQLREEKSVTIHLWHAGDLDHRLSPKKFLDIIEIGQSKFDLGNLEIEIEYQQNTIGKFNVEFDGSSFVLLNTQTNCLASDHCGIPPEKLKRSLSSLTVVDSVSTCTPGSGCC